MATRVTCEIIRSGQARAYADTETVARLRFEKQPEYGPESKLPEVPWKPWCESGKSWSEQLMQSVVKPTIKALVVNFYETGDPAADWASPMLKSLKEIEPGVWEVLIVSAYTD